MEECNKYLKAFKTAIIQQQDLFGFKISIKGQKVDSFLAVLTFTNNTITFPITFTIVNDGDEILGTNTLVCFIFFIVVFLDFDASSVCGVQQEKMLKNRFYATKNIQALLCTLRKICMRKAQQL